MKTILVSGLLIFAGMLQLSAKNYKAAELYSTQSYLYGRFEMRIKAAPGSGQISSFFLYRNDSEQNTVLWREIDLEIFGRDTNSFQTNIIIEKVEGKRLGTEAKHLATKNITAGYHIYTIEWTPDSVTWFMDGALLRTEKEYAALCNAPMSLRFNHWAANITAWVGVFDTQILPQYQYVDYLEYSSYVPASAGDPAGFKYEWRDEFTTYNSSRWAKANWTFAENLCDFAPENAYLENGELVLKLHDATPVPPVSAPLSDSAQIVLYPNPFTGKPSLQLEPGVSYTFSIYSLGGSSMLKTTSSDTLIDFLAKAPAASYIFQWQDAQQGSGRQMITKN